MIGLPADNFSDRIRPFPTGRIGSEKVGKGRKRSEKVGKGRKKVGKGRKRSEKVGKSWKSCRGGPNDVNNRMM